MALEERIVTVTYVSTAAIGQFLILAVATSARRSCSIAGAAAKALGVSRNKVDAAGRAVTVVTGGIAKVKAGAAVTVGAEVASDASGKAVPGSTNPIGKAITAAGAVDEIIEVQLY